MDNTSYLEYANKTGEVISHINLVYITDAKMPITRIKKGDVFQYLNVSKPLTCKKEVSRIEKLVIPPAWKNVKITDLANGHIQAIGRDTKNRKQYKYHVLWTQFRKQTKFNRMGLFGDYLPKIRTTVDLHLAQKKWTRTKVMALVIRLMEETHIRIGNSQYAKRNGTYGLSTLRKRHANISKNKLKFNFTGKRGKQHSITLQSKKLIRLVSKCEEIPGWELFHYFDETGNKQTINSTMVNAYIKEISGNDFTAKDFRTWGAGVIFYNKLMDLKPANNEKSHKKNLLKAYKETAKALGNTYNVCRTSYVHPALPMAYRNGNLDSYFEETKQSCVSNTQFSPSEKAVHKLIKKYKPEFKTK